MEIPPRRDCSPIPLASSLLRGKTPMSRSRRTTDGLPVAGSTFWLELVVYAALIVGYLLLVLKTLDRPLARMFAQHRFGYALVALALILLQGAVLELV